MRSCATLSCHQLLLQVYVPSAAHPHLPGCVAGIDKIGVSIEEPFSILALSDIADTAAGDVHELADMHGSSPEQQHMPCPELVGASALEPCCCGMHSEGSSSVQPFSEGALAPLAAAAPDSRAPAGGARTAVLVGDGA